MTKEELKKEFESVVRWQYGDTDSELSADYVRIDSFKEFLKRVIDKLEPNQFEAFSISFGEYDGELGEIVFANDLSSVTGDYEDDNTFFNLRSEGIDLLED